MPEEQVSQATQRLEALQLNLGNQQEPELNGGAPNIDLPTGVNSPPNTPVGNQSTEDAFVNEFLKNVAPEDLPAVEKYYKDWGAKVTQSQQAKAAELQKYLDLGVDYDSIVASVNLMRLGDTDPLRLYNEIGAFLKEEGLLDVPGEEEVDVDPMFEGASPEMVKKFKDMESKVSKFDSFVTDFETQQKNAEGQRQLDKMMEDLHTRHGKFDDGAILARIMNGMKPDEAVADFNKHISENYNPKASAPPVVGGGRTAVDQVDSSKMKDKKTRLQTIQSILGGIDT
jgi:hypothetical protein